MSNIDCSDAAVAEAQAKVFDRHSEVNWLLVAPDEKGKNLELTGSGSGGLSELIEKFEDTKVMFAVLKVLALDRKDNVTSERVKFIFFSWIGPNVPVMKRARVSAIKEPIESHFNGVTTSVDLSAKEDATMEDLRAALLKCGGAHKPTHYGFGPDQEIPTNLGRNE